MIATPSRRSDDARRRAGRLGIIALLAFPGLLLWLAARLAGGSPRADLWNWPARAAQAWLQHQPFAPWTWVGAPHVASPALFYVVCVLAVLLLGGATLALFSALQGGITAWFPGLLGRRGSPRPAGRRELGRLAVRAPQPRRMIIGHSRRLVATEPGSPLLVFGAPGSGKTAAYCVPIIQEWSGPVVAASRKPDIVEATAGVRQRLGWVEISDQSGATGLGTRTWSPEAGCEDFGAAIRRAGWVQRWVSRNGQGGDAATQAVLAVSLWAVARGTTTMGELGARLRAHEDRRLQEVAERAPGLDPRVRQALAALAALAPAARDACCSAVAELLQATVDEAAGAPPAGAPLHPGELLPRGDGTLYVIAQDAGPARPSPLLGGIVGAVLDEAFGSAAAAPGQAVDRPLLVVLDGVVPTTLLGDLAQYVALAGAIDVTLLITFLGQGPDWYGGAAGDVLGGVPAVVFLGGQEDEETLRLAADLMRHRVAGSAEPSPQTELTGLLGPGQAILLHEGLPPVPLWTRPWFQARRLARLHATQPYVKGVSRIGQ